MTLINNKINFHLLIKNNEVIYFSVFFCVYIKPFFFFYKLTMKVPPHNKPFAKKSTQSLRNKPLSIEPSSQTRDSLKNSQNIDLSSSSPLKSYFTPHIIHLWLKNLESIVHLNESSNKKLNSDFTSWKWVTHREKLKSVHFHFSKKKKIRLVFIE